MLWIFCMHAVRRAFQRLRSVRRVRCCLHGQPPERMMDLLRVIDLPVEQLVLEGMAWTTVHMHNLCDMLSVTAPTMAHLSRIELRGTRVRLSSLGALSVLPHLRELCIAAPTSVVRLPHGGDASPEPEPAPLRMHCVDLRQMPLAQFQLLATALQPEELRVTVTDHPNLWGAWIPALAAQPSLRELELLCSVHDGKNYYDYLDLAPLTMLTKLHVQECRPDIFPVGLRDLKVQTSNPAPTTDKGMFSLWGDDDGLAHITRLCVTYLEPREDRPLKNVELEFTAHPAELPPPRVLAFLADRASEGEWFTDLAETLCVERVGIPGTLVLDTPYGLTPRMIRELTGASPTPVADARLAKGLEDACTHIRALVISEGQLSPGVLPAIREHMPQLEYLGLHTCKMLHGTPDAVLPAEALVYALTAPCLRWLYLENHFAQRVAGMNGGVMPPVVRKF